MQHCAEQRHDQMTEGEKRLAGDKILSLFMRFAIPGIMGFLFMGMQVLVGGVILGRFVGPNALASLSVAFPAYGILITLSVVTNVGCQCLVGIKLGERKAKDANDAFFTAFVINLFLILFWTLPNFIFAEQIVRLIGANDILAPDAAKYLRIISISSISCILFLCNGALRAQGRPFYALAAMLVMVLSNVALDVLLICFLGFGIDGAAWAVVGSSLLGLCVSFPVFLRRGARLSVRRGAFKWRFGLRMLYNGSSEGLSELSAHISLMLFNITLGRIIGESGIAAFAVIGYIDFVAISFFIGLVDGSRSIISFNYGMKNRDRIMATLMLSMKFILAISVAFFCVLFFFNHYLVSLFFGSADFDTVKIAAYCAAIYAFVFPAQGLNILASGYFTAIGNAKISLIISFLKGIVLIAAGLAILPRFWGEDGIWLTMPLAEYATLGLSFYLVARALRSLEREDPSQLL